MKRSRRAYLSVGVTVLIVAAVIFVLICLNTSGETAKVVLPDPDSLSGSVLPSGDPSGNPDVAEDLLRVEMTPQPYNTLFEHCGVLRSIQDSWSSKAFGETQAQQNMRWRFGFQER
jgi:hypothetical protein